MNSTNHIQPKPQIPIPGIYAQQISYSSPLPPPEVLAHYEQVQPGLINKIVEVMEVQGAHRRELETKKLDAEIKHQKRRDCEAKIGQFCALVIALTAVVGGVVAAICGYEWAGSVLSVSAMGSIVYTFIHGRKQSL